MADFWRDFWIRETGTSQQVAKLHDRYDDEDDDDDDILLQYDTSTDDMSLLRQNTHKIG
jgi:hypothetical protein